MTKGHTVYQDSYYQNNMCCYFDNCVAKTTGNAIFVTRCHTKELDIFKKLLKKILE